MKNTKKHSIAFIMFMLMIGPHQGQTQNIDCLSCHAPGDINVGKNFSRVYQHPDRCHSASKNYPNKFTASADFNLPNGWSDEIIFFDRNGNGLPDSDEIQLFAAVDEAGSEIGGFTVECASCHREHGNNTVSGNTHYASYLRIDNKRSELCLVCHKM